MPMHYIFHVIIDNCWLKAGTEVFSGFNISTCICINQASPGTITISNTIMFDGVTSAKILDSDGIYLFNCEIYGTYIYIRRSAHSILSNNVFHTDFLKSSLALMDNTNFSILTNTFQGGSIDIFNSSYLTINENIVQESHSSIHLLSSHNNLITWNKIINNELGLALASSSNNLVHHNTFTNNTVQAYDSGRNNTWYDPETLEGNWWSDYNGTGVYTFDYDATDYYPLLPVEEKSSSNELMVAIVISLITLGLSSAIVILLIKRSKNS